MNNEIYFTGELEAALVCHVDDSDLAFLWGYVVTHKNNKYAKGDWFASSFIVNVKIQAGCYYFETNNSIYKVKSYRAVIVSDKSVVNIRMGCPPEFANNTDKLGRLVELMNPIEEEHDS
jgi:hypothetical protein